MNQENESVDVTDFAAAHGQGLVRFAYVLTRDPDLAQDVVQSVLEKMLRRGEDVREPLAYARRAVVNEFVSDRRRRDRHRRAFSALGPPAPDESPEQRVVDKDALWRALDRLTHRQRVAVVMRYLDDVDDGEIAEALSCSRATVRSLVARTLPVLRDVVADGGDLG